MTQQLQLEGGALYEVHGRIVRILTSRDAGLEEWQLEILRLLASHAGHENAITAAKICERLGLGEGENGRRKVTETIEELRRRFRLPIGGSRRPPHGYFLVVTAEDQQIALADLRKQAIAMFQLAGILGGEAFTAELHGQIRAALDGEQEGGRAA